MGACHSSADTVPVVTTPFPITLSECCLFSAKNLLRALRILKELPASALPPYALKPNAGQKYASDFNVDNPKTEIDAMIRELTARAIQVREACCQMKPFEKKCADAAQPFLLSPQMVLPALHYFLRIELMCWIGYPARPKERFCCS